MGDSPFSDEELNILGVLVLGEKGNTEKTMFKQNPIDPEWQKYFNTINGLVEKLKKMKE